MLKGKQIQELWIKNPQFVQNAFWTLCGLFGFIHTIRLSFCLTRTLLPCIPYARSFIEFTDISPSVLFNTSPPVFKIFEGLFYSHSRETEGKREKETLMWERNSDGLPSTCAPTGDWIHNLGMCPDQESNWRPFSYGTTLQPTEPHQPRQNISMSWKCIVPGSPFPVRSHIIMCFFSHTLNHLLLLDRCVSPSLCRQHKLPAVNASGSLLYVVCSPVGTHASGHTTTVWKGHCVWVCTPGLCSQQHWVGLVWEVLPDVQEPESQGWRQLPTPWELILLNHLLDVTLWPRESLVVGC